MTAPARLNLSKDEWWELKLLAKGQTEWEELDFETKKILYRTPVDLSDRVTESQLRDFERRLALKGEFGISGIGKAAAELAREKVTP